MRTEAIVYTSRMGHTRRYAQLLGENTGLPVCALEQADKELKRGSGVIYLGWLCASHIKGYKRAARKYEVLAVCGVGLCDTGTLIEQLRRVNGIARKMPVFSLQGGMDRGQLRGMGKWMIHMLEKGLSDQKQRSAQDERMLELLRSDADHVSVENLRDVMAWWAAQS